MIEQEPWCLKLALRMKKIHYTIGRRGCGVTKDSEMENDGRLKKNKNGLSLKADRNGSEVRALPMFEIILSKETIVP